MNNLENENPWVRAEKDMFENPESAEYSQLHTMDIPASKLRFHRIQEENESLKKKINWSGGFKHSMVFNLCDWPVIGWNFFDILLIIENRIRKILNKHLLIEMKMERGVAVV